MASNPQILTIEAYQGMECDRAPLQIYDKNTGLPAVFGSSTTLKAYVWPGQNQAALFNPTVSWYQTTGYLTGQFSLAIAGTNTANLDPAGEYVLLVTTTTSGLESPGERYLLKIIATPGSTVPSPPDLISYDYCLSQLSVLNLTKPQIDLVPWLISAASEAIRLECGERYFDLRTLTEFYEVYQDGYCRLRQYPIQQVLRVQGIPNLALTISNTSTSVQTAQAYFSYTGYDGGYGTNAQTATGIILNWTSNGVPASPVTLLYASYPTIGQLASAINAVGSGWTATSTSPWSSWACTELTGGFVAQGCTQAASPSLGAQFNVLSDMNNAKLRPFSSMLYVGEQFGGDFLAEQWGPGGYDFFGHGQKDLGLVKVTYVAGFTTIPPDVQFQTAQLVKWRLSLGIQDLLLKSENADDYTYQLALELVHNMPPTIREALGKHKLHFA